MATATTPPSPSGAVSPEAVESHAAYVARCRDLSASAGVLNATHGHLVDVAVGCLAEGDHIGPGLLSFAHFFSWRTGVSTSTAGQIERIARRADELPVLVSALRAGEISLDQAAVVAQNVPPEYDASATIFAKSATVSQLKSVLCSFRKRAKRKGRGFHVSFTELEDGTVRMTGLFSAADGARIRQANDAMRDDLFRQRQADAKAAAAETGQAENPVEAPTSADAMAAMAETASQAAEAAHPGSERYLVSYHLQATPDGRILLTDDHGNVVDDAHRRQILCDHSSEDVHHDDHGTPLSVGRKTRHINRKLRRAILHRHRCRCAVPGCDASYGLEIHHIWHWEDGGPTSTWNLVPLCRHHHTAHHQGLLRIDGNADLALGSPGALSFGPPDEPLENAGSPLPVAAPNNDTTALDRLRAHAETRLGITPPAAASTPTGERLNRHAFYLHPAPVPDDDEADGDGDGDPPTGSEPAARRRRPHRPPAGRRSPDGPPEAHGPPAA